MTDAELIGGGAIILVNVFTPKPGQLDAFITAQTAEYVRLRGQVGGALGNRLLRSINGNKVVNIAYFSSQETYRVWRDSELFKDHLKRIEPLVASVEPDLYESVYDSIEASSG